MLASRRQSVDASKEYSRRSLPVEPLVWYARDILSGDQLIPDGIFTLRCRSRRVIRKSLDKVVYFGYTISIPHPISSSQDNKERKYEPTD